MEIPYYVHALGPTGKFLRLAMVARNNGDWRKVARLVQKAFKVRYPTNKLVAPRKIKVGDFCLPQNAYIVQAIIDTRLRKETKEALYEVFGLDSFATRCMVMDAARKHGLL